MATDHKRVCNCSSFHGRAPALPPTPTSSPDIGEQVWFRTLNLSALPKKSLKSGFEKLNNFFSILTPF
jgi:hypothetical protein